MRLYGYTEVRKKPRVSGTWYMLAAFSLWGLLPIYWKALKQVPSLQITSHRIFWAFIFISILLWRQKRWSEFRATFKSKQNRIISLTTALILGSNWFVYIWAVNNDHILDASMGYFINPLISVLLGVIFLRERLNFRKSAAVFLAFRTWSVLLCTFIDSRANVAHDGMSVSESFTLTTQTMQLVEGAKSFKKHRVGISIPSLFAASRMVDPSGTCTF